MRHCCSVTPRLRNPGRNRRITASRVRSSAMGSDSEKARIGAVVRATELWLSADIVNHRVAQSSHTRYFHLHHIARFQVTRRVETSTGAAGRTAQYDVARLQGAESRQVTDQVRDLEDHAIARVVLPLLPVYVGRHAQRSGTDLVGGHDVRSDGSRAIEVLTLGHVE